MSLSKIENIVVVMMENRSFDHMLGSLKLRGVECEGLDTDMSNVDAAGRVFPVRALDDTYFPCDPDHSWNGVAEQMAGGNAGFVVNFKTHASPIGPALQDPGLVMGYYDDRQLATYEYLARQFAICDMYFCSVPGPTWPNRLYSIAGTSAGEKDNPPLSILRRYGMPTIFDYLDRALPQVNRTDRWGYFHSGPFGFPLVFNQHLDDLFPGRRRIRPMKDFFRLAAAGTLPRVSWVEPDYRTETRNNDHPEGDVLFGQDFVARVYNAVRQGGANLWERSLLVVTYDEHGGFFDHVPPSSVPPPADDYEDLRVYGLRVPTLVVSPWVPKGTVHSEVLDHGSILKTILKRFFPAGAVPAMTARVDAARDLGPLLSESEARTDAVGIPVTPVPHAAVSGPARSRDLAAGHRDATRLVLEARRPQDIDLARRDHVRVVKSEYQILAESYAADLRAKGLPVPDDDAPEMGEKSTATRRKFGAPPEVAPARAGAASRRKRGKARARAAAGVPGDCLLLSNASIIVQEAADGPHDLGKTLEQVGLITANERARFSQRVRNGVLRFGCAIDLTAIPSGAGTTLAEVRDGIQAAAHA